jgi:SNF2 family DNA or RNA helicase
VRQLHAVLAPHVLRRCKKDVLASMIPAKTELIVRVEMTGVQRKYYKAVLAKDLVGLSKLQGGKEVSAASSRAGGPMNTLMAGRM